MSHLEKHFEPFRKNIVGIDKHFSTPYGDKVLVYADWIASGRLYGPIEDKIKNTFGPLVGNTHSESSITGTSMTLSYHEAHRIIKDHCNASPDDVIITAGSGMTAMVCKFQRMLGMKVPEQLKNYIALSEELIPIVFITHMEHHSNQTSWLETIAEVVVLEPDGNGLVNKDELIAKLKKYSNRKLKIGAFTACSNVTGIETPYYDLAEIMHQYGGYCFVDFACSAPYAKIDMHPPKTIQSLDAIFFSPHKFLGGPGSAGVLIFNSKLYKNQVPDLPGGGTVDWTNPWGQHKFINNIEIREDGGTPAFLQAIKAALAIKLKDEMGLEKIREREEELVSLAFKELRSIEGIHILADNVEHRLGAISFYIDNIHYNLLVKIMNDRFGIQVRGGCSCAGTYGHYLLHVDKETSKHITDKINEGDFSEKPGWVRLSIHPTMRDNELIFISDAIRQIVSNISSWEKDYIYLPAKNEFVHAFGNNSVNEEIRRWFELKSTNAEREKNNP